MKIKKINPDKFKFYFSLLVDTIVIFLVILASHTINKNVHNSNKEKYDQGYERIVEGYSEAVRFCLTDYFSSLDAFNVPEVFTDSTPEQIHEFINKYEYKNHPDFYHVSYISKEGLLYPQGYEPVDCTETDFYKKVILEGQDKYLSDVISSPISNTYVITVTIKAFDINHNANGALQASIKLSTLSKLLTGIKIVNDGELVLQDSTGSFIVHPVEKMLFKKYVPPVTKTVNIGSEEVSKMDRGKVETVYYDGSPLYLYFQTIENTGWKIGLGVKEEKMIQVIKEQTDVTITIIVLAIIITVALLILENRIMKFLQKKQLIKTLYDPLTNLWTRAHFEEAATKMMRHFNNSKFMMIECDIRGFKFINQNYGEAEADKLLIYFSQLLKNYATKLGGIIGRGFADHFYIFIKIPSVHKSMNLFREQMDAFNNEIKQYDIPFFPKFGISFLVAKNKSKDSSIQGLIGQASFAKSTIKDNMLTQFSIYNSRLLDKINEERYIENHMYEALEKHEFFVMYQPKVELSSDTIVGAEALVRWDNPEYGIMTPDSFIPLFERNGFIKKLDFYVYEEVFKMLRERLDKKLPVVPISINMSRNHSKPDRFMHDFMAIFKKYAIPANLIEVEILERSVMDNQTLKEITEMLHKEGFTVAMDDFGSGESSLNMLTTIPVDVLKFDRSFLTSSTGKNGTLDKTTADFIQTLVGLSKTLKKRTIFEGVETKAQRDFLKDINCEQVQGFFYSKPLSAVDFEKLMNSKDASGE